MRLIYINLGNDQIGEARLAQLRELLGDAFETFDARRYGEVPAALRTKFRCRDKNEKQRQVSAAIAYTHYRALQHVRDNHPDEDVVVCEDDILPRVTYAALVAAVARAPRDSASLLGGSWFRGARPAVESRLRGLVGLGARFHEVPYADASWYGMGAMYYPPGVPEAVCASIDAAVRVGPMDCFLPRCSRDAASSGSSVLVKYFHYPALFDHNDGRASHHYESGQGLARNYLPLTKERRKIAAALAEVREHHMAQRAHTAAKRRSPSCASPRTRKRPRLYVCQEAGCSKPFTDVWKLNQHTRVHSGERPFRCTQPGCGKAFTQSGSLTRHMRVHTGERPFRCQLQGCGRAFAQKSTLTAHLRVHTGERPFRCQQQGCGKAFAWKSALAAHRRDHTGAPSK